MSHWMVFTAVVLGAGAAAVIAPDLRRYLEFSRM